MKHTVVKRTLAGVTAVLCVAGNAAATAPVLGGIIGTNAIIASAEKVETSQIEGDYVVIDDDLTIAKYSSEMAANVDIGFDSRSVVVINGNLKITAGEVRTFTYEIDGEIETDTDVDYSSLDIWNDSVVIVNGNIILEDHSQIFGYGDNGATVFYTGSLQKGSDTMMFSTNMINIKTDVKIANYGPAVAPSCKSEGNVQYFTDFDSNYYVLKDGSLEAVEVEDVVLAKTDHTYGKPVWTWDEETHTVSAKFTCVNGDDEQNLEANVSIKSEIPATDEADGEIVYLATVNFGGTDYTDEHKDVIPATGEVYASPYAALVNTTTAVTFNGMEWYVIADNSTAENEGTVMLLTKEPIAVKAYLEDGPTAAWNNDQPEYYHYSTSSIKAYLDSLTEEGGSFADVADAIAPTNLKDDGEEEITGVKLFLPRNEVANISADVLKCPNMEGGDGENRWWRRGKGNWNTTAAAASGTIGNTAHDICVGNVAIVRPVLNIDLSKVDFDKETKEFDVNVIHYAAAEPTCTMPGIVEYWYDSKNNKLYLDEALTQEFTDWKDVVIPPLEHDLDEPEWTWGEDNKTAHVTVTCKRCKEKVVDADAKVTVKRVEPTAEKAGSVTYTAAVMVGGEYYVDTKVEVLDKLSASNMPVITFERGDFRVKLNWTASEGATRYAVCGYVNKTWKILAQGNDTSYILTKLTPGVNYKVAVIPMIDGAWKMDFSNAVTVTPKALKVPKLTVEQGENDIKLDWTEVEGAEKYGICGVVSGKWTLLDEGFNTSYILKNLKPGTKYTVAVIAKINGKWVKDYSNQVEVTTKTPVMPTVSYEKGKNAVKLTWTEYEGAEKYAVCGYSSGKWTKLAEGTGTSYIMNNLKTGSTYKVAVTVKVNGRWKVDYSNAIEVAPLDQRVLEYPEVKSQAYKDKFILKWSAVKNAEGYALAAKQSGKWTIKKQFDANTTTFTSPSMSKGDYRMVIIAKVDGKWQTNDADNRAITVSIF